MDDGMIDVFTRDGRLTDLALELYQLGELDDATMAKVEAHLDAHPEEAARLDEMDALGEEFAALPRPAFLDAAPKAMPPVVAPAEEVAVPAPANRGWSWSSLAMAAVALLVVGVSLMQDRSPTVGQAIGAVWKVEAADDGGDGMLVKVQSSSSGHWMLLQVPEAGGAQAVYPAVIGRSERVPAGNGAMEMALAGARADAGARLVAVRCDSPFGVGDLSAELLAAGEQPVTVGECVAIEVDR